MNKRELSKVFSKLSRKEVNLESHKVDLALKEDISKLINKYTQVYKNISKRGQDRKVLVKKINELKTQIGNNIIGTESEISGFNDLIPKMKATAKKVIQTTKELGVNPGDIKDFGLLETLIAQSKSDLKDYQNDVKNAEKLIK
tara:strand:+ start:681 stop:1109 length:429 start_codon:yes stop_codon:yes gene_type:complete